MPARQQKIHQYKRKDKMMRARRLAEQHKGEDHPRDCGHIEKQKGNMEQITVGTGKYSRIEHQKQKPQPDSVTAPDTDRADREKQQIQHKRHTGNAQHDRCLNRLIFIFRLPEKKCLCFRNYRQCLCPHRITQYNQMYFITFKAVML